ncbi:uncharacterized protein LOC120651373 isoform X2 [Panicum virgatum]|uniref:F-box domain-containing protein n=1 Tax=Panicum virgatum TaxID=38727 RepID=A0A8T0NNK0_PANVG|nr:uncharacterized protein LOC120651373 isoform X2 [Panicum virgatum]KAG2549859.1 hypothetical protein PVAP13_9KG243900 [Panicum virgatum]
MGSMISRPRQRAHAPQPPTLPLDDDDLLSEILLRLPRHPACLLRASLVCTRWRRLLRDPGFLRRSRAFHRTPPVLGLFRISQRSGRFVPVGEAPDRVASAAFALPDAASWVLLSCRHGRALLRSRPGWLQLLVWDPITRHRRCVRLSRLGCHVKACNATVLGDPVGVGRREGSFRVAFVFTGNGRASACVYSSETSAWGRLITAEAPCDDVCDKPSALVGDAVYWLLDEGGILELHLGKESLASVEPPPHAQSHYLGNIQLMESEAGVLGLADVKQYSLHLWVREADGDGNANWVLRTAFDLSVFAPPPGMTPRITFVPPIKILGVDEGGDFAFLRTICGIYMLSLDAVAVQLEKVSDAGLMEIVCPCSSFFVAAPSHGEPCRKFAEK